MRLLVIADGPRDEVTLPPLVSGLLNCTVDARFESWSRLHLRGSGRGYARKLQFAIGQAQNRGLHGLVAVADQDRDRDGSRKDELHAGRAEHRSRHPVFPTAIGVACPHVEAWLLDDPVAVREGFELESNTEIPSVRKANYPKDVLDALVPVNDSQDHMKRLAEVAVRVQPDRSNHRRETGFAAFVDDIRSELGPLVIR